MSLGRNSRTHTAGARMRALYGAAVRRSGRLGCGV